MSVGGSASLVGFVVGVSLLVVVEDDSPVMAYFLMGTRANEGEKETRARTHKAHAHQPRCQKSNDVNGRIKLPDAR